MHAVRIHICNPEAGQDHAAQLRSWFEQEWGAVDAFDSRLDGRQIPALLAALDAQSNALGGLAFTTSKHPSKPHTVLWVNALYVLPAHRNSGIASRLVLEAERSAGALGFAELYVLTHLPSIYQRLGWTLLSKEDQDCILVCRFEKTGKSVVETD